MATVSGSFTSATQSTSLRLQEIGEEVTVSLSGTYSAVVQLERALTPDETSWERVMGPWRTDNATVAEVYRTTRQNEVLRLRATSYTSGTVTYSFSDGDKVLVTVTDRFGNVIAQYAQSGLLADITGDIVGDITGDVDAVTVDAEVIEAGDASLGINGIDAAQGGAIVATGGTSSTAANAGGAVSLVGGTPGATGVGGAASITGGAGGATSGVGGEAHVTGGAATAGNSAGGEAGVHGGAGQGTGAGGEAHIEGGDSGTGATGTGGECHVHGGDSLATNGAGGEAHFHGGAGAGTGAGGAATLIGGAGGATGAGGDAALTSGAGGATSGVSGNASLASGTTANATSGTASATGTATVASGAPGTATTGTGGASGDIDLITADGGSTSGAGGTGGAAGSINVTPGAGGDDTEGASGTGGDGGSVVVTPGAGGSGNTAGIGGHIRLDAIPFISQGAPAAKTTDTTLTAAELLGGLITVNQGAAGTSTLTLPTGTNMDAAVQASALGTDVAFEWSLINISTVDAEDALLAVNTGHTIVGNLNVEAQSAAESGASGRFLSRRTAANTWITYRIA